MTMPQTGAMTATAIMLKTVGSMALADKRKAGIVWVRTRAYELVHDLLLLIVGRACPLFFPRRLQRAMVA